MASSSVHNAAAKAAGGDQDDARASEYARSTLAPLNEPVSAPGERGHARSSRALKRPHDEKTSSNSSEEEKRNGAVEYHGREKRVCVEKPVESRTADDMAVQVATLAKNNEQLKQEVASLKCSFSERDDQVERVVGTLGSVERMEREMKTLQSQYEACSRNDLTVIQDALERVTDCLGKVDQLQHVGSVTAHELQSFRQEYSRQINTVLEKVDLLGKNTGQRTALNIDAVTAEEIHQLRDELAICKDELTEMEPRRASVENEFFQRMERFSNQLDHVRLQMSKMEQDLLQKNDVSRRSLETLMSRQMTQFRHSQSAENKRLRDEMDELRSDMCEILKEMHLLKERTKYLGRENRRGNPHTHTSGLALPRYTSSELRQTANVSSNLYSNACLNHLCARPPQRYNDPVPVHGDDELYCQHHHCPAGIQPLAAITPRAASPPRLTPKTLAQNQSALLQAAAAAAAAPRMVTTVTDRQDLPRFCPSPHYSSRSSSVSGRISATRDENAHPDGHVDDRELERRLLEQHRLFWISEGAGSVSQASLEAPTPKFADEV